ncbi:Uncharacterized protein FWK35_00024278 [Aphis craccivora]|uniref:Uncharacterized protein n=1 Tax=Aphis craccivora TaxID=307492 RepID=A0A6G0W314_APHCR|nr:Uncharacterized protein FWK35_00024278 [Aphis craccivora]
MVKIENWFRFSKKSRKTKKKKKMTEKREFLRKTSFRSNRFFYMVEIQKLITLNFQKNLTFFDDDKKILEDQNSNFYEIYRKSENLQIDWWAGSTLTSGKEHFETSRFLQLIMPILFLYKFILIASTTGT